MKNIIKKLIMSGALGSMLLLFTVLNINAATSDSVLDYEEIHKDTFGVQYTAPYSSGQRSQETVDTSGGTLNLTQVDLQLPGKNGLDVVISRSYNSDSSKGTNIVTNRQLSERERRGKAYLYQLQDSSETIRVLFRTEEEMLHFAPEQFYARDDMEKMQKHDNQGRYYYDYHSIRTETSPKCYVRVKTVEPITIYIVGALFSYTQDQTRSELPVGHGWRIDFPEMYFDSYNFDFNTYYFIRKGIATDSRGNMFTISTDGHKIGAEWIADGAYISSDTNKAAGISVQYVSVNGITENGITYSKIITEPDGRKLYFQDDSPTGLGSASIRAMEDKYGNRITYTYGTDAKGEKQILITDTYGRIITVQFKGGYVSKILYPDPDTGEQRSIVYSREEINNGSTDPERQLTVDNINCLQVTTADGTTTYRSSKKQRTYEEAPYRTSDYNGGAEFVPYSPGGNVESEDIYTIDEITYPTGLSTRYKFRRWNTRHTINKYSKSKYVLMERHDESDEKTVNQYTYTYNHPNEGIPDLIDTYTHTGTVTRMADGYLRIDTYNNKDQKIKVENKNGTTVEQRTELTYSHGRIKSQKVTTRGKMAQTQDYVYDGHANITKATENGFVTDSTYDLTYNLPLTTTYKQDADTTVVQENTLTADKKSIDTTVVKVNDVIKSKTKFTYDQYGNVTAKQMWESDTNGDGVLDENDETVTLKTDYIYNPDHTWSLHNYVENVQDADGNTEAQIGYTATYDVLGNLKTITD
ncbi:MAG: hypothetical protein HFI90_12405, partial [Clostridia bacterium]|nr:hypothetical protein [Clostridia bacterium]